MAEEKTTTTQAEEHYAGKRLSLALGDELARAGATKQLTWTPDGRIRFAPEVTPAERAAVMGVVGAHDPAAPVPPTDREAALAGLDALAAEGPPEIRELAGLVRRLV